MAELTSARMARFLLEPQYAMLSRPVATPPTTDILGDSGATVNRRPHPQLWSRDAYVGLADALLVLHELRFSAHPRT